MPKRAFAVASSQFGSANITVPATRKRLVFDIHLDGQTEPVRIRLEPSPLRRDVDFRGAAADSTLDAISEPCPLAVRV